ncbi:PREDICTED: uncharacterized protein LOC108556833 isoform X1 [Nicrophorus vespilloides]|uniref:Uncharacterized protein LOC108556833 isoform X1 n=1 Tax=Nicrophorus vespilloides TaxID=110193 RepID=A0ABM1M200_NICVS|nr:PREDICTED: uncharacterized protein LOC108556833 isoform X1 [Nicrophorus vespilloides]
MFKYLLFIALVISCLLQFTECRRRYSDDVSTFGRYHSDDSSAVESREVSGSSGSSLVGGMLQTVAMVFNNFVSSNLRFLGSIGVFISEKISKVISWFINLIIRFSQ